MIKEDKRKYSICIVSGSPKDNHYKHLDSKRKAKLKKGKLEQLLNLIPYFNFKHKETPVCSGLDSALKEAQSLANQTGKKVTVLTSAYNVYPSKKKEVINGH